MSMPGAQLDPAELERILRRIDENLAHAPLLPAAGAPVATAGEPLADLGDLPERIQELHRMQAPLFVVQGRLLPRLAKRLLNLPIRVFGYKQRSFNRTLVDTLGMLLGQIHELRQHVEVLQQRVARLEQAAGERASDEPPTARPG